ncbi:unnamed protein product [Ilex paraguariensis]|uniref:Mitochondrial intermembrane space import and assembly protein 40 homolog n=1 Tax=Ilex paraguariensis TaxID=185542 RepID=A0ABC8R8Z4_9AQUA
MGQVQSEVAAPAAAASASASVDHESRPSTSSSSAARDNSQPASMESLIAEAAAFGNDGENESLDVKAQKALECPCIAHLRSGSCGTQFSGAFLCFLKSTAEEKAALYKESVSLGFYWPFRSASLFIYSMFKIG